MHKKKKQKLQGLLPKKLQAGDDSYLDKEEYVIEVSRTCVFYAEVSAGDRKRKKIELRFSVSTYHYASHEIFFFFHMSLCGHIWRLGF